jgi:hypothetical protein
MNASMGQQQYPQNNSYQYSQGYNQPPAQNYSGYGQNYPQNYNAGYNQPYGQPAYYPQQNQMLCKCSIIKIRRD